MAQTGDPSDRLRFMGFYLAAPAARVVLKLSPGGIKAIANGDVEIFMGSMFAWFV